MGGQNTFDTKFIEAPHPKKLKIECKNRMEVIKTLSYHSQGAEKNRLFIIGRSLILSKTDYSSIIYNFAKPDILQIIDFIHNEWIRQSIDTFGTS